MTNTESQTIQSQPCISTTQMRCVEDLCYHELEQTPPFSLLIDPRYFYTAQINGIKPSELFFFDTIKKAPTQIPIIIDFIAFERSTMKKLNNLLKIIDSITVSVYEPLKNNFIPTINQLLVEHATYLQTLEKVMNDNEQGNFLINVIEKLTAPKSLIDVHKDYTIHFLRFENTIISFSIETPQNPLITNDNDLVIHYFKIPFSWEEKICETIRDIKKFVPDLPESNVQSLTEFQIQVENLSASIDSIPKLEQISRMFIREPLPIVRAGRRFLREGRAMKQCRKVISERHIILFSDYFIYAQPKGGMLMIPSVYNLSYLRVDPKGYNNMSSIYFYAPQKSFILYFQTKEERDSWHKELTDAISNAQINGKNVYEEAPIWVPDIVSDICMRCGAQLGFFNRKHHCRVCGKIMCSECVSKRFVIKRISQMPSKVCFECYDKLVEKNNNNNENDEDVIRDIDQVASYNEFSSDYTSDAADEDYESEG
ncbi:FYVE zinc finger family protein [Histomonas meleagridis]|uniref:FYVE zinc finger family protein n=1 Tax=Histomonas meleagridis TaxID=135588 RepID=UPI003559EBEC|nr:FYVE zinc finger family protein [Histomonas meleagridis]KAH0797897.1 FYVE zinc finger family protein [Histomonas meleagridis]